MLAWFLYGTAVSLLLALAARVTEPGLRSWKMPVRWVWLAALLGSLALPAVARFAPASAPQVPIPPLVPHEVAARPHRVVVAPATSGVTRLPSSWQDRMEKPLRATWLVLSGCFGATLLLSTFHLARRRRRWARATVADTPVLVSDGLGPALVGLFRPEIVLPSWALGADRPTQRLMVAHEREHLEARDHWLVCLALVSLALVPWNLPMWWIVRRLRHAIELDCDRRVLRGGAQGRAYGALLLKVSQGPAPGLAVVTPLLGEPVSYLERRIRAMSPRMPKHPRLLAGATAATAGLVLWATFLLPRPAVALPAPPAAVSGTPRAETMPPPVGVRPGQASRTDGRSLAAVRRSATGPVRSAETADTVPDERVRAALARWHPELLRAPDRSVMVYFVASRDGVVQKSLVVPIAEMQRAVADPDSRPQSIRVAPGQAVVVDSTNHGTPPQAWVTRGRDVLAEIRAEVGPNRIQSVETWTSQAVPGGVVVGWVTLR